MSPKEYDAIVIGAGQGGIPIAMAYAGAGKRVAIVERAALGGTCVNYGCTPTKTLVHVAKVAQTVRRAGDYGIRVSSLEVDMPTIRGLKRGIVTSFREGLEEELAKVKNLKVIYGTARFTGRREVEVALRSGGKQALSAPVVIIDTGGRPRVPDIDGLDRCEFFDSTSIMELDEVPESLVVLGAGSIGLEFAQLFARLGSKVTVLEECDQFLPREDRDMANAVLTVLRGDGLDIRLGHSVERVERVDGRTEVRLAGGAAVSGTHFLVAAGRTPSTDELNLAAAGVECDKAGYIKVNDKLESSAEGVYAIGDVKGGPAFTHVSYDDYRILSANLLHGKSRSIRDRLVPSVIFIDPQYARIGSNESELQGSGVEYRVAKLSMAHVARAIEMDETQGVIKALVEKKSGRILGAAVFGVEGGEIMAMLQLAMASRMTDAALKATIFAHPTLAELLNNLFA